MFIFGYHHNHSFYDVYNYDWTQRDSWGADCDSGGGCPFVLPLNWNLDEKSIAPIGADRSPPWHQISVSERRYNNRFEGDAPQWEHQPVNGDIGGDLINLYNTGLPIVWAISETHIATTKHAIEEYFSNYDTWHFMNPDGEMFRIIRKDLEHMGRADGGVGFDQLADIFIDGEIGEDLIILEIDTIQKIEWNGSEWEDGDFYDTMTKIRCPPITKYGLTATTPSTKFPVWLLDRQGRCVITYNNPTQPELNSQLQVMRGFTSVSDQLAANTEYFKVYSGDSGTPAFVNTEEHGFIFCEALWGALGLTPEIENIIQTTFNITMPDIEYIDLNSVTLIDYWEHPDVDYRSDDTDEATFVPTIPNQSTKVEMNFTDDDETEIDYTSTSNEVSIDMDNASLLRPNTFNDYNITGFLDNSFSNNIVAESVNHRIHPGTGNLYLKYTDDPYSYKHPSQDNKHLVEAKWLVDGVEFPMTDTGLPTELCNILQFQKENSDNYYVNSIDNPTTISNTDLIGYNVGDTGPFSVKLNLVSTLQEKTVPLGTLIKSRPPEGIDISYDSNEIYNGNTVTFSLTSENDPFPEISFQPDGFFLYDLENCSLVSSTNNTVTLSIDGPVGETMSAKFFYYWAINDNENVPITANLPFDLNGIVISEPIIVSPDFTVTISPTETTAYESDINIIVSPLETEVEKYIWKVTQKTPHELN